MIFCSKLVAVILTITSFFTGLFSFGKNTVYYFDSVHGNDLNSGTSESSPLKTLSLWNEMKLKSGDTVLIKTDSVYRSSLVCVKGVKYGSYGTGRKPVFMPSINAGDQSKWKQTADNIWKFNQIITDDAGNIIFDGGKQTGIKITKGIKGYSGNVSELKNDLEFVHDAKGYVSVCSTQNPAERFASIEIACQTHGIVLNDDVTLDSLCVLYAGAHGIYGKNVNNVAISNCEVGYCGGSLHYEGSRYGNGIEFWSGGKNITVDSCNIYQIYDAGLTIQSDEGLFENVQFINNTVNKCTYSIEYFNDGNGLFKNILMDSNVLKNAGYGWGAQRPDPVHTSCINSWYEHANKSENFIISNNTLRNSRYALFNIGSTEGTMPVFIGNTYQQPHSGRSFSNHTNFKTAEAEALLNEMDPTGIMKYCSDVID